MQRISITNPQNIIDGTAKKYYFKLRNTGGPKGDKGDKGDTGATGPQGPQGNAATVSVGSTTTLPVGYDATVENVGSIYNAVLNFGIPQGPQGPQGAKGDKGDTGARGETGPRGPQGEKGTNATVYVGTTSTLNPGSQATVYNSGTDSNAVLNFGIPKGEKGDTGPMPTIAQTTGQATDQVMSQKATTDALNTKQATISSSNKLSADLVTDTTTTNKFVTAEDKTAWNAKQNALTAGQGINITSDVISTPALVPEVVAELPTTGTEGKLYLTPKAHTTQTATGNPVTATVAEQAGKIESFKLDGDTFQKSYTGKNLFDVSATVIRGYINNEGKIESNTTSSVMTKEYYPIQAGDFTFSYDVVASGSCVRNIAFYDASKVMLSRIQNSNLSSPITFTAPAGTAFMRFNFYNANGMTPDNPLSTYLTNIQLESGSSASSYEPYVGGQPSPNPDYPQPIQTVTGEQTVSIIGKNLFNKNAVTNGGYIDTNGEVVPWETFGYSEYIRVIGGQTYSYSGTANNVGYSAKAAWYDSNKNFISAFSFGTSGQVTAPATAKFLRTSVRIASPSGLDTYQLELGSTITTYEAYRATNYPLDLGTIELNGLGDDGNGNPLYKDRIYRDGNDWKVHKATGEYTLTGDEAWSSGGAGNHTCYTTAITEYATSNNVPYSQYFRGVSNVNGAGTMSGKPDNTMAFIDRSTTVRFYIRSTKFEDDAPALKTWLSTHNTDVYYALKTPTDTVITDTTLIAQLEAIRTASLATGANTITNNATAPNLAGDMEIGYYGYNPTNRYDKWIWLDFDNSYEQLNNPESTATLSTRSLRASATEQTTPTRSVETVTLKKGASEPIEDKTELPTILDDKTEEAIKEEYAEPVVEESEIEEEPKEENSEQVESEKEEIKEEKTDSEEPVEERKEEGR